MFFLKKKIKFNFNDLFFFLKRVNVLIISKHPSYMLFIITKSLDFCNNNISLVCHSSRFLCCYAGFCRTRPTHSFHSINLFINVLVSALQKNSVTHGAIHYSPLKQLRSIKQTAIIYVTAKSMLSHCKYETRIYYTLFFLLTSQQITII